jgi:hypothetical protein
MTLPIIQVRIASSVRIAPEAVGAVLVHVDAPLPALDVARPVEARVAPRHGLERALVLLAAELHHVDVAAPLARLEGCRLVFGGGGHRHGDGGGLAGKEGEGEGEGCEGFDGEHFVLIGIVLDWTGLGRG